MRREIVKISVIISVYGIFIILFVIFFIDIYRKQSEKLCADASSLFTEVVKNEVNQVIKIFSVAYNPQNSPNDIPGGEKIAWQLQDYITSHDPNRHMLDSLFQSLLKEKHMQAKVAIRCIWKGKVIDTSADSALYKEVTPIKSIDYRLNEKREDNITLQAYADFSVGTILAQMEWFWIISSFVLIGLLGGGWFFRRLELNKRHQCDLIKEKDSKLIESEAQREELEKLNQQQSELIDRKQAELTGLQTLQEDSKNTNEMLTRLIGQKESELVKLQAQRDELEKNNKQQSELIDRKESKLTDLRTWKQEVEKTCEQQAKLIARLQAEIVALKGDIIHLEPNEKLIWIKLPCNLYFDEKHGLLRNESGNIIQLKDNALRIFCHFLEKEENILTHKELCFDILHVVKDKPEDSDRNCIFTAISRLRKTLKPLSCINFISVGKVGYQMTFSNYQNDTTLPGKSD